MNLQEFHQLQAEKKALAKLLAGLPRDRAIERIGLESRIKEVEEVLASQPAPTREPTRAHLTFRGKPVVGSQGIFAEFGALAVKSFTEAVTAIGASLTSTLGSRGALPGKDNFQLLITGTALGSFGFQLEEAPAATESQTTMFPEDSLVETAIERTRGVMAATLGTDDELTEAIADADPRALDALRKFLETMEKSEAVCALDFKGEVFRFADVEQVRRSIARLAQDNIHEEEEELTGTFEGVLPNRGTFEFRVDESGEVIVGRVGNKIDNPASINSVLKQPAKIQVHSRRVGEGRPRYVLLTYEVDAE